MRNKKIMNTKALILPGIGNSDPDHWQSFWEEKNPSFVRIQQRDWNNPICKEWSENLEGTLSRLGSNVVLIAHSLACTLVAHWALSTNQKVQGAFLVAPPNPDGPNFPEEALGFSPMPLIQLPFPSIVVASTNDPYGSVEFAESTATAWGSRFISVGSIGHINSQSGLGEWKEGFLLYNQLSA